MKPRSLRWMLLLVLGLGLSAGLLWPQEQDPVSPVPQVPPWPNPRHPSPAPARNAAAPTPARLQAPPPPSPQPPAPVEELEDAAVLSKLIRGKAMEFKAGRNNVFFKEREFLRDFVRGGPGRIQALKAELLSTRGLEELPPDVSYLENRQPIIERMGMVDMLEGLAGEDRQALHALAELARAPLEADLPPHIRRARLGDKYDALVSLTRVDRELGFKVFSQLQPASLKQTLMPAIVGALLDKGVPPPEAARMTSSLL
ncbi:MAG TPA: hypothetical protein VFZ09_10525 [Archangium sp.]|uniref:hypothetical protein n=1 Tax=Archangium sp. TaxID=1872627 RepID=UPI002E2EBF1B|nr:hypothetical protein [Archangium sp.]HEX5746672.1 hypothetical protein [Archangium sp.]